jgi:hypothetical protein
MTLKLEDILDRVARGEDGHAGYRTRAARWEQMWRLKAFDESAESWQKEGREQVTLPDPYNVVNLAMRLLADDPSIEVPSEDVTEGKDESAEKRQQFLTALWYRAKRDQRTNLIKDAAWQGFVRGRFCFEIKWIREQLPPRQRDRRMPLLLRTLDPMNVVVHQGPLGPMWGYHKYESERVQVLQRWPELAAKLGEGRGAGGEGAKAEDVMIEMIDFWWVEQETGAIWNAVLADDEFASEPKETDYPDIPLVVGMCDGAPVADEESRSLSILHPLDGLWQYQCRLASQMGTGMLWYFWPAVLVKNELGHAVPDFEITPGTTTPLTPGTSVEVLQINPNVPLAQALSGQLEQASQASTFPSVMYGDSPGNISAGYGIQILADAASGRVDNLRENLEMAIEIINEIALALVEKMAGSKGVAVWGRDEASDGIYHVELKPSDVAGYLENYARLNTNVPNDDIGKQTLHLRLVEAGILSKRTYRQKSLNMAVPSDEEERVLMEQAMMEPQIRQREMQEAINQYYPEDASAILQAQQPPPQPEGPPMGPPQGPPGMPPGMAPGMAGPAGPPMVGPPPPMAPPPMGPPAGPPMMGPPGMGPGPMGPPGMGPGPGMGGMPSPEALGGMSPEMLGMPPEVYAQIMNGQQPPAMPTDEELMMMGGMPPG